MEIKYIITLVLLIKQINGFWRLTCEAPVVIGRIDPITSPGTISRHVHSVSGASKFDYVTTYSSLKASECTTCHVAQDKSAYWVPQLYYTTPDGQFEAVKQVGGITAYYLPRGQSANGLPAVAFPEGIRIVAGTASRSTYDPADVAQKAIGFSCLGGTIDGHSMSSMSNCPDGLRQEIFFPNCWDGVSLDSTDHKSHMTYSGGDGNGACPTTHPVKLVSLFYEVMWNVDEFKDEWSNESTPPFVFAQGDRSGYGSHADFISGWDAAFLQEGIDTCTSNSGRIEDCPIFDTDHSSAQACNWQGQSITSEDVLGTSTRLDALPGANMPRRCAI